MRGAPVDGHRLTQILGIIPADAGSTACSADYRPSSTDHPRGCGEHCVRSKHAASRCGSSPRMRGAHHTAAISLCADRIIPADAGSTWERKNDRKNAWDHPRGCGEHLPATTFTDASQGSSPRMRGARIPGHVRIRGVRIIPADAGSTLRAGKATGVYQDHPRGCGEHGVP